MNILCIYSVDEFFSTPSKPLAAHYQIAYGLSIIMTMLQNSGHNVELLVFSPKTQIDVLDKALEEYNPALVCFSSVYTQFNLMCKIASRVKEIDPSIYTSIGGAHASLKPDKVMEKECFDAVCVGEGEKAMPRFVEMLEKGEPSGINNMWFRKKDGTIEKNPQDDFIEQLDQVPYINRKMWDKWILNPDGRMTVVAGRGCPFQCTYCSNHCLSQVSPGNYFRFRSVENVIGEIELIVKDYPEIDTIFFEIETLSVNLDYTLALCDGLKELNDRLEKPLSFGTNFTITENVIESLDILTEKMKLANFKYINTGLESGSLELRKNVLRRPDYSNEDLIKLSEKFREKGIKVYLYALLGIPDETLEDFKKTIELARQCKPEYVYLNIVCPYPGTDLYSYSLKKGYLKAMKESEQCLERRNVFLRLPRFSRKQIIRQYRLFPYRVFKGLWPFSKIIAHIMGNTIASNSWLNHIFQVLWGYGIKRKEKKLNRKEL